MVLKECESPTLNPTTKPQNDHPNLPPSPNRPHPWTASPPRLRPQTSRPNDHRQQTVVKRMTREYFPRVREAREALQERALELLEFHQKLMMDAAAAGDFKSALKASQWLIEHMPKEDGEALIDNSPDLLPDGGKGGNGAPTIQIGIALGGVGGQKALPTTQVIDITPLDKP